MPTRITREGLLLRALDYQGAQGLALEVFATPRRPLDTGGVVDAPEFDALRAAWSPAVVWDYVTDPAGQRGRVLRFTGPGRLYLESVAHPPALVPGDVVSASLEALVTAAPAGNLRIGVHYLLRDGSTVDLVIEEMRPADAVLGAWAQRDYSLGDYPGAPPVPADAVAGTAYVEADAAGWHVSSYMGGGNFTLDSYNVECSTVTIRRGRTSSDDAPAPATCSAVVNVTGAPPYQAGDSVRVEMPSWAFWEPDPVTGDRPQVAYDTAQRFRGIADEPSMRIGRGAGPHRLALVATSQLRNLSTLRIGDEPWPQEAAGLRVQRILQLAQQRSSELVVDQVDTAGPAVLARDVDRQPVASLLSDLVRSSRGQLLERLDGSLAWRARETPPPAPSVTLGADHYAAPLEPEQESGPTSVTVLYGDPNANPRASALAEDTNGSVVVEASVDTELATQADAQALADDLLAVHLLPPWRLPKVTVDLLDLARRWRERGDQGAQAVAQALLQLQPGDVVELDELPAVVPELNGAGRFVVDGWDEVISASSWRMTLQLSDVTITAPRTRYVDVPASWSIADVPGQLSILAATTWRPSS